MKLRLIRHGQTPNNVARVLDTAEPGALLTQLGHDQAEALPQKLVTVSIDSLYVSTLTRTQLTAQPLARARELDPQIRQDPGDSGGTSGGRNLQGGF